METDLPSGWVWARLEDVTAAEPNALTDGPFGSNLKSSDYAAKGARVIRLGNVGVGAFDDSDVAYVSEDKFDELRKHEARPGDLVVAALGDPVGRACEVPSSLGVAIVKADCVRLRVHSALSRRFVMHALNSPEGRKRAEAEGHGLGRLRINMANMRALPLPLAPSAEQQRIVDKLESLLARSRRAREALDAVPSLLERLRQSVLAAAFRGDLTADWRAAHPDVEPATQLLERIRVERRRRWEEAELARLCAKGNTPTDDHWKAKYEEPAPVDESELPELPEGWCWAGLGELAAVGTGATPLRSNPAYWVGGTIGWVNSGQLNAHEVTTPAATVTELAVQETNLTVYPPGTLLMAMYGEGQTRGRCSELKTFACTNQAIAAIALDENADALRGLVKLALQRNYYNIRNLASGGVQPNLNLSMVRAIAIAIAPLKEAKVLQRRVEEALASSSSLAVVRRTEESFERLEQSLLAKAFRGELVPQDPNDEPASVLLERIRAERAAATENAPARKRPTGSRGRAKSSG